MPKRPTEEVGTESINFKSQIVPRLTKCNIVNL